MKIGSVKRILACVLTLTLVFPLAACRGNKEAEEKQMLEYQGKKNQTIDSDSKWVNSGLNGMIDKNLETNLKDDFYSYINKDWILKQKVDKENMRSDFFYDCYLLVKDRKISIVSDQDDPEANKVSDVGIDPAELAHDEELVQQFTKLAADWDKRNELGMDPVVPYMEAIKKISSMEDMAAYIADVDGENISGKTLIDLTLDENSLIDTKKYKAILTPMSSFTLRDINSYLNISGLGIEDKHFYEDMIKKIMKQFGYSAKETDKMIHDSYDIEAMLVDGMDEYMGTASYFDRIKEGGYTIKELQEMAGDYPMTAYLQRIGYDKASKIYTAEEKYVKQLGKCFKEANLEKFKSYYLISTALYGLAYTDRASYDLLVDRDKIANGEETTKKDKGDGDSRKEEEKDEWDLILNHYISEYLAGPLDIIYVSRYCNSTQKEELAKLVSDLVAYYKKMIDQEDWLSEKARKATKEKLDAIKINILYPDNFDSYMDIQFAADDSLIQMVQKVNVDKKKAQAALIEEKVDHSRWNLADMKTTDVNAAYMPSKNAINIFAGIIANGMAYQEDMPMEEVLARIGVIVGHEISHAFDTTGCHYDKYGNKKDWWELKDLTAFETRSLQLMEYYNTLYGYPNSSSVMGMTVSGEVIADMGGMKSTLELAKSIEGFDYDKYFRAFAQTWRTKQALILATQQLESDPHPLNFLRVNVTLMQFEEFYKSYDIQKGDGMYMAPKKRIAVW